MTKKPRKILLLMLCLLLLTSTASAAVIRVEYRPEESWFNELMESYRSGGLRGVQIELIRPAAAPATSGRYHVTPTEEKQVEGRVHIIHERDRNPDWGTSKKPIIAGPAMVNMSSQFLFKTQTGVRKDGPASSAQVGNINHHFIAGQLNRLYFWDYLKQGGQLDGKIRYYDIGTHEIKTVYNFKASDFQMTDTKGHGGPLSRFEVWSLNYNPEDNYLYISGYFRMQTQARWAIFKMKPDGGTPEPVMLVPPVRTSSFGYDSAFSYHNGRIYVTMGRSRTENYLFRSNPDSIYPDLIGGTYNGTVAPTITQIMRTVMSVDSDEEIYLLYEQDRSTRLDKINAEFGIVENLAWHKRPFHSSLYHDERFYYTVSISDRRYELYSVDKKGSIRFEYDSDQISMGSMVRSSDIRLIGFDHARNLYYTDGVNVGRLKF